MIEKRQFYIDGAWVDPVVPHDHAVIDPATEEPCAIISLGADADADRAVAAAQRAFAGWSQTDPRARRALIERLLAIYEARLEEMAQAISLEMGAPITLAREQQATSGNWHIRNFLRAFDAIEWVRPLGPHAPDNRIALEPIGVAALITPWNWPMNQIALKVTPALLAGCTVVFKPSEQAPLSAMLFAEMLHEAGVPKGVFNLVNGDGAGVGSRLSSHPDVEMVSFTGSTRAGKAISRAAADTLKRVTLELGGKGANLIFADADPGAVRRGVLHCFENSGQSCNAPTRMLVERPAYAAAVAEAARIADELRVASPRLEGPHIGPVVNRSQFARIEELIEAGIAEGARLVAGGPGLPEGMNRGFYVRPTVFADVRPGMRIEREEIFGPVLSILPFDTEEEAVAIANDTPYGLTNYVQSGDGARRNRLARQLRSGMVQMNGRPRGAGAP
ncbi:MAG: aldehyde dehydrogenase family protein, partial [Gemmobacter sp.]